MDGAHAGYVLIPLVQSTFSRFGSLNYSLYVLMADIFVAGYFGILKILKQYSYVMIHQDMGMLQVGAVAVGIFTGKIFSCHGFSKIAVVDTIDNRLALAKKLGAAETVNFKTDNFKLENIVSEAVQVTDFGAVLEIFRASTTMKTVFDSVR